MKTCPREDSSRFLSGQMSPVEIARFEDHLEHCSHCQQRLEQQAGGADAWHSVREIFAGDSYRGDLSATAWGSGWPGAGSSGEAALDCTSSVVLSFLAPAEDPALAGRIGPYDVSALLGRGSAGIVLKGYDSALHRNVAIKVLDPSLAGVGAARQRFAREARALAAISHEHLVPIYEVSEHAGLPYFVMEYVPGGSLERRLREHGPLDVVSIVRIGLQTAQALAAAHGQGLVHRDIKPGNILLDRGTERVRVADFGLVRIANDASCTRSGIITGTPQYMSPEQVKAEPCDGQSDLFSLGAVLYALCTGHPPFRADTVYGVMHRIVHESPRSIRDQNPAIPEWLEAFILKLLARDRSERFVTADEVVQILQQELAHLQNPGGVRVPPRKWCPVPPLMTPRRWRVALVVVAVVCLVSGLSWWRAMQQDLQDLRKQVLAGNRTPELPPTAPQPTAPQSTPLERRPTTPHWDADGTADLKTRIEQLGAAWSASSPRSIHDPWPGEIQDAGQQLENLRRELEAPR